MSGEFVSVGWGSKETQFHGSEGKDSRTKKEVQGRLADWDDRAPRTVWRADGLYFAVNAVNPSLGLYPINPGTHRIVTNYSFSRFTPGNVKCSWSQHPSVGMFRRSYWDCNENWSQKSQWKPISTWELALMPIETLRGQRLYYLLKIIQTYWIM